MEDLKKMIKERGLTVAEVCQKFNFKRATYFRMLKGKRELSEVERLGLESLPKVRGRKRKQK